MSGNNEVRRLPPDPRDPCPVGPVPPAGNNELRRSNPGLGAPCPIEPVPLACNSEFRRLPGATQSLVNGFAALAACGQKCCNRHKGSFRSFSTYIFSTDGVGYLVAPHHNGHESTSGKAYTMLFQSSLQATGQTLMGCPEMAPRRPPSFPL